VARFRLTRAVAVGAFRFHAGEIVVDGQAAVLAPTDRIWNGLTAASMISGMVPLDATANTMKSASIYANEPAVTVIQGVDSIG
jgi:hypothetical protein